MNLTALDIFLIALGVCVAALIGWLFVGDDDA
jgi:hypothetical protein